MKKLLLSLLLLYTTFSHAVIRYVTVSGAGSQDGTSWANAASGPLLQDMIDASSDGDQVWVAVGVYKPTTTFDRTISFSMKNGVAVYGGFAGTETMLSQRVFNCGPKSILSGDIGATSIDDNSYRVISNGDGLTNSAILDGFEIRDANETRTPPTNTEGLGGGIFNNGGAGASCSPTIRNCVITNNRASFGAGIFNSGYNGGNANPIIENCVIANNHAYLGGGGLDNYGLSGNASPTISNCIFYSNTAAEKAGAMYCWGGGGGNANPVVRNTAFVKNSAIDGGAIVSDRLDAFGGSSSGNSNPTFVNCIFRENTATALGPHFFILGNATMNVTYTALDLTGQNSPHVLSGSTTGNLSANPLFEDINDAIGNDDCWFTADDGLRLESNSPAINAGTNANALLVDIAGDTRIVGTNIDMGPYESEVEIVTSIGANLEKIASVFPNPALDKIKVLVLNDKPARIYLNTTLSQAHSLLKEIQQDEWLDVSNLPPGLYLITVYQANVTAHIKWIKK